MAGKEMMKNTRAFDRPFAEPSGSALRFTVDDAQRAYDEWGWNCGPGALCAVLDMTPDEIRPHMLDFELKRYTNPTLMRGVLNSLGIRYRQIYSGAGPAPEHTPYPRFGLVRVQWAGSWTKPGVPMRARYRQTHWVATRGEPPAREVFDVNAMSLGGWLSWREWSTLLVPWLIRECCPKGNGEWWPTHGLEIGVSLTVRLRHAERQMTNDQ